MTRLTIFISFCLMFCTNVTTNAENDLKQRYKAAYAQYKTLSSQQKWQAALPFAKQAYELGLALLGEENKNSAALAYNYGLNLLKVGAKETAIPVLETTLALYENSYGNDNVELIDVLMDLGHAKTENFDSHPPKKAYSRALSLSKKYYGANSLHYGELNLEVGSNNLDVAQSRDAKRYLIRGYKTLKKALQANDPRIGLAALKVGKFYLAANTYKSARDYFLEALALFEQPGGPSNALELHAHGFLVTTYERMKQPENATQHALAIGKMTPFKSKQDYLPLVKVAPEYPQRSLRKKSQGYVIVQFDVHKKGQVQNAAAVESAGDKAFIPAAISAVNKFRYAPAFKDGQPVVTTGVQNIIRFTLKK